MRRTCECQHENITTEIKITNVSYTSIESLVIVYIPWPQIKVSLLINFLPVRDLSSCFDLTNEQSVARLPNKTILHYAYFSLRQNREKTTDYIWSQGFVVEQHGVVRKSFKTAIESLAILARIFQVNDSPTSTLVFLSLEKACRIMMQEPSNSMNAHEPGSKKNFPTSFISSKIQNFVQRLLLWSYFEPAIWFR